MSMNFTAIRTARTDTYSHHTCEDEKGCTYTVSTPDNCSGQVTVRIAYKHSVLTFVTKNGAWMREQSVPDGRNWKLAWSLTQGETADRLTAVLAHCTAKES